MPFKSEKQRRYLWATHPELAKRWAHEYPQKKKLPMYVKDKKEKRAAGLLALSRPLANIVGQISRKIPGSSPQANYVNPVSNNTGPYSLPRPSTLNNSQNWQPPQKPAYPRPPVIGPLPPDFQKKHEAWRAYDEAMMQMPLGKESTHEQIKHLPNNINNQIVNTIHQMSSLKMKTADSKQEHVVMPRSDKPTYAGEERAQGAISGGEIDSEPKAETNQPKKRENAINSLLQKISTVVAPAIRQRLEDAKAQAEGRLALKLPKNLGVKKYPVAAMGIPLPMGMTAQQPQQSQPQVRQPGNSPTAAPPVGKGGNPMTNPIQSFGAISANNNLNGNAAFGAKNSPLSSKSAAAVLQTAITKWAGANTPCSCGCGDTVKTCKCAADCACRKKGGSCYKGEKQSASSPAWQRSAGKNEEGGLNAKGRASYNRETGGNLKAPVTEKNPSGSRAKRQNSFCSRMCGMKRVNTGSKTKSDPDSRINKALRKWNCRCS